MKKLIKVMVLVPLACICLDAAAETFKCVKEGKTVYSDLPCASTAARVDDMSDKVSRVQRRQADDVNRQNRQQLSELEYQAARDRYTPRKITAVPR